MAATGADAAAGAPALPAEAGAGAAAGGGEGAAPAATAAQFLDPAGHVPPGMHRVVTCPSLFDWASIPSAAARAMTCAFLGLKVHRVELTYHNSLVPGLQFRAMRSAAARSWLRLREVNAAWASRSSLAPLEQADLGQILAALPAAWRAHVQDITAPALAEDQWYAMHHPGDARPVFRGRVAEGLPVGLWDLLPSGRLVPLLYPLVLPAHPPRPALVDVRPPPPGQPWLVGVYDEMDLDPTVWGLSSSATLATMTVRAARSALVQSLLPTLRPRVEGFTEERAAWPPLWRRSGEAPPVLEGVATSTLPSPDGLEEIQASWLVRIRADAAATLPEEDAANQPPPPSLGTPRVHVYARVAARVLGQGHAPPVQAVALRPGFAAVWRRLQDKTLLRPHRITCWRLLHASLGCNAFLRLVRGPRARLFCEASGCTSRSQEETLTHCFLDCPEVKPAIDWMLATWLSLTGDSAPRTGACLLADDQQGWATGADAALLAQWTRLRVATLGAIWQVRCSRLAAPPGLSFSRRVVKLVISSIVDAIKRDWWRTGSDTDLRDSLAFSRDWVRGTDISSSTAAFVASWAAPPVFCRLVGAPPAAGSSGEQELKVLLGREGAPAIPP